MTLVTSSSLQKMSTVSLSEKKIKNKKRKKTTWTLALSCISTFLWHALLADLNWNKYCKLLFCFGNDLTVFCSDQSMIWISSISHTWLVNDAFHKHILLAGGNNLPIFRVDSGVTFNLSIHHYKAKFREGLGWNIERSIEYWLNPCSILVETAQNCW